VHVVGLWAGLQDWVMGPDRTGLIGQNKEGLVSLPGEPRRPCAYRFSLIREPHPTSTGYIAIYLLGIDIGHYILPPDPYFAFPEKPYIKEEEDVPDYDSRGVEKGKAERRKEELGMILASYAIIWWSLLAVIWLFGGRVSRRLVSR
jgi:phosphatidylinositol glycan class W